MYDIKPLEEEWNKYQKNKRKPWIIVIVTSLLIIMVVFYVFNNKLYDFSSLLNMSIFQSKTTSTVNILDERAAVVNTALLSLEISKIKKNMPIIKPVENETNLVDIPILDVSGRIMGDDTVKSNLFKERKTVHLNIIETTNVTAYKDVERRFYESHDTDDSLFLAKSYYKKGQYKKAEHWAYETNKINANIAESLFIFVQAKVKLGKKNEALSILSKYIKKTNSYEARHLLSKIENNQL